MLIKICTWSGIICPSIISTPLYLHSVLIISCKSFRYWLYIIFLRYFGTITIWYLHNHFVCDKLFVLLAIKILLSQYSKTWTTLLYYLGEFFCITFYAHPHSGWLFGLLFEQTSLKALIQLLRSDRKSKTLPFVSGKCFKCVESAATLIYIQIPSSFQRYSIMCPTGAIFAAFPVFYSPVMPEASMPFTKKFCKNP